MAEKRKRDSDDCSVSGDQFKRLRQDEDTIIGIFSKESKASSGDMEVGGLESGDVQLLDTSVSEDSLDVISNYATHSDRVSEGVMQDKSKEIETTEQRILEGNGVLNEENVSCSNSEEEGMPFDHAASLGVIWNSADDVPPSLQSTRTIEPVSVDFVIRGGVESMKHCKGWKNQKCTAIRQTGTNYCQEHLQQRLAEATMPKVFGKYATTVSYCNYMIRLGKDLLVKESKEERKCMQTALLSSCSTGMCAWVDLERERYGADLEEMVMSTAQMVLDELINKAYSDGTLDEFITFSSLSTIEIHLDIILFRSKNIQKSSEVVNGCYRLLCLQLARAADSHHHWRKKSVPVRPNLFSIIMQLPEEIISIYSALHFIPAPSLRCIPCAEDISDSSLCIRTVISGSTTARMFRRRVIIGEDSETMRSLSDFCMVMSHFDNDGKLESCPAVDILKYAGRHLMCSDDLVEASEFQMKPGQSILYTGTQICTFSSTRNVDGEPCVQVEEPPPPQMGRSLRRTASGRSIVAVTPQPTSTDNLKTRLKLFSDHLKSTAISLEITVVPHFYPEVLAIPLDSIAVTRMVHGFMSKEWVEIREMFIEAGYDFDSSAVPPSNCSAYIRYTNKPQSSNDDESRTFIRTMLYNRLKLRGKAVDILI